MQEYDLIFVLLVYRNTSDLKEFVKALPEEGGSRRVVVVNSFYDDETKETFENICSEYDCDFINTENNGYGAGNNLGIAYALEHYRFRHLIVCNPDIVIERFPEKLPEREGAYVLGPEIRTFSGKRQNPCMVFASPLREYLLKRFAMRPSLRVLFYAAIAINKLERIFYNLLFGRRGGKVYSLHGSFLIFSRLALEKLGQPFDPRMFLFREEDELARKAKSQQIRMIFDPSIRVLHKEDGSVHFISDGVAGHTIDSLRTYFGIGQD